MEDARSKIPYHGFSPRVKSKEAFRIISTESYIRAHREHSVHRHSFYELLFIWKGGGRQFIDFQTYSVRESSVLFIQPNQVHRAEFDHLDQVDVLTFSDDFYRIADTTFLRNFMFPAQTPTLELSPSVGSHFKSYLTLMKAEYAAPRDPIVLRNLLDNILRLFDRFCISASSQGLHKVDPRTITFQQLLENHYFQEHSLGFYADRMNVTGKHLNSIVKKDLGKSATQLLKDRIVLESKRLLSYSDMTQKEIAFRVGFADPSYFSHFFKRYTGLSPSQFKE